MITLWKDSKEEVWYCGESLVLWRKSSEVFKQAGISSSAMSFLLVFVSECKQVIRQLH